MPTNVVPEITGNFKDSVYASGVSLPKQASALELHQLEQQAMLAAQPQAWIPGQPAEPTEYLDPMVSAQMPQASPMARPQYGQPGASVSTFGGPDASGGR